MINYERIKNEILNFNKSRINLEDLYKIASNNDSNFLNRLKTVEYADFFKLIKKLSEEGILKKCGKETNKKTMMLYLKYTIIKPDNTINLSKEDILFLATLNSKIDTKYYRNHPEDFLNDKKYIAIYNDFLNNNIDGNMEFISINERSYQLFKDEKFIKGGSDIKPLGETILLKRLKLTYEDIGCYRNYEPMLMLTLPEFFTSKSRNILIIENLDTYWTINKLLLEHRNIFKNIDLLIFGQGNAINGLFNNYKRYGISSKDNIYYFGDIDNHGFFIYKEFKNRFNNLNISLAKEWYEIMIEFADIENLNHVKTPRQNKVNEDKLDELLLDISKDKSLIIKDILLNDKYIPQEVLNYSNLKRKFLSKEGFNFG